MLFPVLPTSFYPPILTLSLSAWRRTHPPIPRTCWHTNTVFRKQNIPGNMTGIWKCLISLDGWVSNPQANEQGREGGRERGCGGTLFILPRPDGEGSFGAARPLSLSGHDMHTTQHTHRHSYLSLFVQQYCSVFGGLSESYFLDSFICLCFVVSVSMCCWD